MVSWKGTLRHFVGMGKRREARERAVQFLFQHDLNPPEDLRAALDQFWDSQRTAALAEDKGPATWGQPTELPPPSAEEAAVRVFADPLIEGVVKRRDELDEVIKKHALNWELHRIAAVDRNVLRLAIFEMLHRDDIPPVVSINEAVDIAKKFSTPSSGPSSAISGRCSDSPRRIWTAGHLVIRRLVIGQNDDDVWLLWGRCKGV